MDREAYVYILAGNRPAEGVIPIYVGSTSDLVRRVWQHKQGVGGKHTAKYRIHRLVWYEVQGSIEEARLREHRLKRWDREWKDAMIGRENPEWRDLYLDIA